MNTGFLYWDQRNKFQFLPSGDLPDSCWSLYKRNSTYTGACIRIATSAAGNAETDIGFVNNRVDTAAILAHVGTNTAWVVTWYDQIGSNNLTSVLARLDYSPRIAHSSAIVTFNNGQPAIEFGQGTAQSSSGLYRTTGDLFPSSSSIFYTYESTYTGLQVMGGSGSTGVPFRTASESGGSLYPSSSFNDPFPVVLYVNEANPVNSNSGNSGNFYTALNGNQKIACETSMDLTSGTGFSIGMRADNPNSYFRGKSSETLIYNDVRNSTQVYDVMKILNKSVKAY